MRNLIIIFLTLWISIPLSAQELYQTNYGQIEFVSDAPLEWISARSTNCQGILSIPSGEFVFRVFIKTFDGFNNPIQKVHFYENYMETNEFPEALFQGYVIEKINFDSNTQIRIRAKGNLTIHGTTQEKIIPVVLTLQKNGNLVFESSFQIILDDFNIAIPSIVKQKIAEKIEVKVYGRLENQIE